MFQISEIDNINVEGTKTSLDDKAAHQIAALIRENMLQENSGDVYTEDELSSLLSNKTSETVKSRLSDGYLVYISDNSGKVVACGMVCYRKDKSRYEAKTLHVHKDYRGKGLAQKICDMREARLRSFGVTEIFIESLKFPGTIRFHKRRGFCEVPGDHGLKRSVLMKKKL